MCTVTFWPGPVPDGYLLAMNRDERRTRAMGLPPRLYPDPSGAAVHPLEPGGGTWIALNEHRIATALVNWYRIPHSAGNPRRSRGEIVRSLRHAADAATLREGMATQDLADVHPFRLVAIVPGERRILEWRWDTRRLAEVRHPWKPRQWISSGWDEPRAQRIRSAASRRRLADPAAGTLAWIRALHASHDPEPGPFSTCMHRPDAETVSYTEIEVGPTRSILRHLPGPPCRSEPSGPPPHRHVFDLAPASC